MMGPLEPHEIGIDDGDTNTDLHFEAIRNVIMREE
jgi:hypothetical protein